MPKVVGIDLGTTNSLVAYVDSSGKPQVIENKQEQRLIPSVVHYSKDKGLLVGEAARAQLIPDPMNTIYSVKRFMGKGFIDATFSSSRR
jgi:molecular chaperone DnaK